MKNLLFAALILISTATFAQKSTITKYPTEPIKIGTTIEIEGTYNAGDNETVEMDGIAFVLRVFDKNSKKFSWKATKKDDASKGTNKGNTSASLKIKKKLVPSSELKEGEEYRIYLTFKNSANKWIANWKKITLVN